MCKVFMTSVQNQLWAGKEEGWKWRSGHKRKESSFVWIFNQGLRRKVIYACLVRVISGRRAIMLKDKRTLGVDWPWTNHHSSEILEWPLTGKCRDNRRTQVCLWRVVCGWLCEVGSDWTSWPKQSLLSFEVFSFKNYRIRLFLTSWERTETLWSTSSKTESL